MLTVHYNHNSSHLLNALLYVEVILVHPSFISFMIKLYRVL